MAAIYRHFAGVGDWDFSDTAAQQMFDAESKGASFDNRMNGYAVGKAWMDLTITEYWLPDLAEGKLLFPHDLYSDPNLPKWFLDRVLPERFHLK